MSAASPAANSTAYPGIITTTAASAERLITFRTQGAVSALWDCTAEEVVISGAAGTGKTRGALELLHYRLATTPGVRALMLRKTEASLKATAIITFDEEVHPEWDGVVFMGSTKKRPAMYVYPNGSTLVIGGIDNAMKVMSATYDLIYVPECTELDVRDWEALLSRTNRPGRPKPLGFTQLMGDCNPQAPTHWLKLRADAGALTMLVSTHEDNPSIYDVETQTYTSDGVSYIATLDKLTGVRYLRLRKGQWAAAEGMVYQDSWSSAHNLIDRFPIPPDWPRYLAVDFGYGPGHPFVCQWWAEDHDGRLYRYREIYRTRRLVEDHARDIRQYSGWGAPGGDPYPYNVITDHDAEDRATLEKHLGLITTSAHKTVSDGIQAVAARMRLDGDGKPRLFLLRDSLVARDPYLTESKQPTCTEEEVDGYVWATNAAGRKDQVVKDHDHGLDALRYMVAHKDLRQGDIQIGPRLY